MVAKILEVLEILEIAMFCFVFFWGGGHTFSEMVELLEIAMFFGGREGGHEL